MTCRLDACQQGRKDCPCPDICGDQPKPSRPGWAWQTLVYLTICATAVGFVALWVTR